MDFPHDDTGDVLRRIYTRGNDLSRARNADFTVVFPDQTSAETFAEHFRKREFNAATELSETAEGLPWDVVVVKHMALLHEEITDFEETLQQAANPLGGRNDGWGCISEPSTPGVN
jgi:hypothetical protein